jgi:hypothetical protein
MVIKAKAPRIRTTTIISAKLYAVLFTAIVSFPSIIKWDDRQMYPVIPLFVSVSPPRFNACLVCLPGINGYGTQPYW